MKKMIRMALCFFLLIASLTACVPSRLDMNYGMSFKRQKLNQIADPDAGKELDPAEGVNGKAAEAIMVKYQKGFEKEPPATVYNLTIGGIK